MKIIKAHVKQVYFHYPEGFTNLNKWFEEIGRTCYKSEDKITDDSAEAFVDMIKVRGHDTIFEHAVVTARIVGDRGLTHELVRHRVASFAQESTRYCNYSKGKFNNEITLIHQFEDEETVDEAQHAAWWRAMRNAEASYMEMIELGAKPGIARSVLPIGLKAEIVITANLREWAHIFELRMSPKAHAIIRDVMTQINARFKEKIPTLFA